MVGLLITHDTDMLREREDWSLILYLVLWLPNFCILFSSHYPVLYLYHCCIWGTDWLFDLYIDQEVTLYLHNLLAF